MKNNVITTVNYHLTKKCNFKCKYCFARFDEIVSQPMLSEEDSLKLIKMLADSGHFNKINFVGGEPMRYPHDFEASAENLVNCRCLCTYS